MYHIFKYITVELNTLMDVGGFLFPFFLTLNVSTLYFETPARRSNVDEFGSTYEWWAPSSAAAFLPSFRGESFGPESWGTKEQTKSFGS